MAKKRKELPIEWDVNERERFKELVLEIKKRCEKLAQQIKDKIKQNLHLIKQNPFIFEEDVLKIDNDDSFRKFTVIYVKVVYKVDADKIIIARVRHATSEPTEY